MKYYSNLEEAYSNCDCKEFDYEGNRYPTIPILHEENTKLLNQELYSITSKVAKRSIKLIKEIENKLTLSKISTINFIVPPLYLLIWQKIYNSTLSLGGSLIIIKNKENCKALCPNIFNIDKDRALSYWLSNEPRGNQELNRLILDDRVIKVIRTMDKEGNLIPDGSVERDLIDINLLKAYREKGSFSPTYRLNVSNFGLSYYKLVKDQFLELAKIAFETRDFVRQEILQHSKIIAGGLTSIETEQIVQAGYYVFCYGVHESLKADL
ncbi:MAG: hypothetical protein ACLFPS_09275 [Clostridia bacterium]